MYEIYSSPQLAPMQCKASSSDKLKQKNMNRSIKFRAWSLEKKEFIKDEFLLTDSVAGIMEIVGVTYKNDPDDMDDEVELSQFTGLHDKNGRQIFEGDILKGPYTNPLTVVYENGAFCFHNDLQSGNDRLHQMRVKKLEIIGNIYENPELVTHAL